MRTFPDALPLPKKNPLGKWGEALRLNSGDSALARELGKTKADYQEQFEQMGLPTYARCIEPLNSFLEQLGSLSGEADVDQLVRGNNMQTATLWYQLIPRSGAGEKMTVLDVTPEELIKGLQNILSEGVVKPEEYDILVSEFLPNEYGGQIVIDDDGGTAVYFGEGLEEDYSTRERSPQFDADNKRATRVFHYSFDNPTLRQVIYSMIKSTRGVPGYYEFALGRDGDVLRPIFLDYRPDEQEIYRPATSPQEVMYEGDDVKFE